MSTDPATTPDVHYRIEQPTPQSLMMYCGDALMAHLSGGQVLVIAAKFYAAFARSQEVADLYCEGVIDGILQVAAETHHEQDNAPPPEDAPFPATLGEA